MLKQKRLTDYNQLIDELMLDTKRLIDQHVKKPVKTIRVFQPINTHQVLLAFLDDVDLTHTDLKDLIKKSDVRVMNATTILAPIKQPLNLDFTEWPEATHELNKQIHEIISRKKRQLQELTDYLEKTAEPVDRVSDLRDCLIDAQANIRQDLSNYLIVQPYGENQLITANIVSTEQEFSIQYNFQTQAFVLPEKKHIAFSQLFA